MTLFTQHLSDLLPHIGLLRKYINKVLSQMKKGDFHGSPESVKAFEADGIVTTIKGGNGVTRQMLKIPGGCSDKKGFFEFIQEADGSHRLFRPNP